MGIKERYQELRKKHKLPSFNEINKEFEISTIEKEEFLLREIRRKIAEKIEAYTKFLEDILHPDPPTTSNMYESRIFNDEDRNEIFKIYKRLMFFDRFSIETAVDEDDKKSSEYINAVFKEWGELKKQFLSFVKKSKESWLKDSDLKPFYRLKIS